MNPVIVQEYLLYKITELGYAIIRKKREGYLEKSRALQVEKEVLQAVWKDLSNLGAFVEE